MNSSSAINTLYGFFGQKKNKLLWSGSLGDLKAFVLTIIDESTDMAESGALIANSLKLHGIRRAEPYVLMVPTLMIYVNKSIVFFQNQIIMIGRRIKIATLTSPLNALWQMRVSKRVT